MKKKIDLTRTESRITPRVVHCRKEMYDIYIGRPIFFKTLKGDPRIGKGSIWRNPFKIKTMGSRAEALKRYRAYILSRPDLLERLPSLRGKVLGCWCSPDPCHGDILAELASLPDEKIKALIKKAKTCDCGRENTHHACKCGQQICQDCEDTHICE